MSDGYKGLPIIAAHHLGSTVEALQEAVAHFAEMRHLFPARAQRARTRQSVALAFSPHVELHGLVGKGVKRGVRECNQVKHKKRKNLQNVLFYWYLT